jgi:nanoRNase/pAp phosphatase (c-di-AMP/oligoRNAs hydrolase)
LYPEVNVSVTILWGYQKQNTVFTVGKSIFNRTNPVNIGDLMLFYGGGGHAAAGTCQVDSNEAERVKGEIIKALQEQ